MGASGTCGMYISPCLHRRALRTSGCSNNMRLFFIGTSALHGDCNRHAVRKGCAACGQWYCTALSRPLSICSQVASLRFCFKHPCFSPARERRLSRFKGSRAVRPMGSLNRS